MGVTEEAPKVTYPTPHTQWPSRMRVGLIKCEEGEKGCRVRNIQAPAPICARRKEKGGQFHRRAGTTHSIFNLIIEGKR